MRAPWARRAGLLALATLLACASPERKVTRDEMDGGEHRVKESAPGLRERLAATTYRALFQSAGATAATLWSSTTPDEVAAVLADADADPGVAFLAAELAIRHAPPLWRQADRGLLARAYVGALCEDRVGLANPWGLPGTIGDLGKRLLSIGEPAVPGLLACFDISTPARYGGSEDAGIAESYAYRVKDLAAFYVAQIRALPFEVARDPSLRDGEIDRVGRRVRQE